MLTQKCKNDMGENEPETDSQRTNETKFLIEPNDAIWIHIQCLEYQLNYKAWLLLLLFINRLVSNQRNIKRAVLFHVRSELKKNNPPARFISVSVMHKTEWCTNYNLILLIEAHFIRTNSTG